MRPLRRYQTVKALKTERILFLQTQYDHYVREEEMPEREQKVFVRKYGCGAMWCEGNGAGRVGTPRPE